MKLGIGHLPEHAKIIDFVLSKFNNQDQEKINGILYNIKNIIDKILDLGFDKAISNIANLQRNKCMQE